MNIAEKLATIAENEPKVFAAGKKSQNEEFWRTYQASMMPSDDGYGTGQAGRAFAGSMWNSTTFYPMFDIKPRNGEGMFYYFSFGVNPQISLTERLNELGIELDTSKMDSLAYMFYHANIDDIPTISAEGATIQLVNVFYRCKTSRIREFIVTENNTFSTPFSGCTSLVDIKVSGTIGNNGFNMSPCTNLSRNSILSVLQTCNKANAGVTITLPAKCIDGKTVTETYIANDTELNTAFTLAKANGYTFAFA